MSPSGPRDLITHNPLLQHGLSLKEANNGFDPMCWAALQTDLLTVALVGVYRPVTFDPWSHSGPLKAGFIAVYQLPHVQ